MGADQTAAVLFPGQGVGDASSRELVELTRPDLLELAVELVGEDPFARISEGTRFAQPAVYCASIAGFERLGRPAADYYAGHSLGEVGALAAAGAIDDDAGLRIVAARGRLMEEAARAGSPGGMLAVGSDRDGAEALSAAHGLVLANENSPQQFVLSGSLEAIGAAQADAKRNGTRVKRLAIAGAFHTEAMLPAVEPFRSALREVDFRRPRAPVVSSSAASFFADDARETLAASLTSPIRWVEAVRMLHGLGITRWIDVGPGKVLAGLVRRTIDGAEVETFAGRESSLA